MNRRIACNKDLNAKGKAVELTVSVNGKLVITQEKSFKCFARSKCKSKKH